MQPGCTSKCLTEGVCWGLQEGLKALNLLLDSEGALAALDRETAALTSKDRLRGGKAGKVTPASRGCAAQQ